MEMYAIIYQPTGVPVGLFISKEHAISRCKHLTRSRDFIVARVSITQLKTIKTHSEDEE